MLLWTTSAGANPPVLLVLGDSLSAGYGIDVTQGWVALLEARLEQEGHAYRVVNASVSGDTTHGGLARVEALLASHRPSIVIVELGGNDGLRGLPVDETRNNLARMIDLSRQNGAKVLLAGMRLPPNYGVTYTRRFHALYQELGETHQVPVVPFFLDGIGDKPELMQTDGIHPRAEAQARMVENIWPALASLL
jgi:acyl-CoA thioesterase-1